MNRFVLHHQELIRFGYSCFDRILCYGSLPQFRHSARAGTIAWFLRTHRQAGALTRAYFGGIARQYHDWLVPYAQDAGVPLVQPPDDVRREDWVEPFYQQRAGRHGIAVILKVREPERIVVHLARTDRIAVERRWVNLYYFYLDDPQCGRMFLRLCPYFPFNLRVWLNGHNWLARRLQQEGIAFVKRDNVFVDCADPGRLQQLSDGFGPGDVAGPVAGWVARLLPFFTDAERQQGYRHQLFLSQVEYCHNLVFHSRAAVGRLFDRLLDANRSLGHPDKLAVVFGRPSFRPDTRTGQTVVKVTRRRTPVITTGYRQTTVKQYVSHQVALRTESTTYRLDDLAVNKRLDNLPAVRDVLAAANDRYLTAQQDVLATYVDRDQLHALRRPTVSATGRRVPGLHVDDPRLLAVLQAVTCFAYLAGKGCFRTTDLLADVQAALGNPGYRLAQLRYDLSKLRGKGLVQRRARTQTYSLTSEGYRLAVLYLKLYHRLYGPLTAAIRDPVAGDNAVPSHDRTRLDRLYVAVDQALRRLTDYLGIAA